MCHILIKKWILKQTLIFFWAYLPVTEDSSVSWSPGASVWLVKGRANFGGIDLEPATVKESNHITYVTQQMLEYQAFLCSPNKCMVLCIFLHSLTGISNRWTPRCSHTTWSKFFTQSKHQINHLNALAMHIYIIKVNLGTMSQTKHFILMHWVVNSNFHPTRFSQNLIKLHHSLMKSMISPTCPEQWVFQTTS